MFDWLGEYAASMLSAMPTSAVSPSNDIVDPLALSRLVTDAYQNVSLAAVNDHEIRMSVMTSQFRWHHHPNSDETFYGVDGELIIEFPDREMIVRPGQFVTVPAGTLHRTRPAGERSVNLTFERVGAETIFAEVSPASAA
jgi:mannose-6-phosphate isomerase-like protein (cupin superfamily)